MPAGLLLPPRQAEALLGLAQPELRTQCLVSRAAGLVMQMSVLFPTNSRSPQSAWRSPEALVRQSPPLFPVSQLQGPPPAPTLVHGSYGQSLPNGNRQQRKEQHSLLYIVGAY